MTTRPRLFGVLLSALAVTALKHRLLPERECVDRRIEGRYERRSGQGASVDRSQVRTNS
jgi:hypothetical protein